MTTVIETIDAAAEAAARRRAAIRRYTRHPGFMIGAIGILLLVHGRRRGTMARASFADAHGPDEHAGTAIGCTFWLGTDQFGQVRRLPSDPWRAGLACRSASSSC
jgi:peptide/nickel transport system permease protein